MVSALIALVFLGTSPPLLSPETLRQLAPAVLEPQNSGPNLVVNPEFGPEDEGWARLWTREEGAGSTSLATGRKSGDRAIAIHHRGSKDWAVGQVAKIPVREGQLYELSAWMKNSGDPGSASGNSGTGTISAIAFASDGTALNWELGRVGPVSGASGKDGWQLVKRYLVVPKRCTAIQFRIVGYGVGETMVSSPSLYRVTVGNAGPVQSVHLESARLSLDVLPDGSFHASSGGRKWDYRPVAGSMILTSLTKLSSRSAQLNAFDLTNSLALALTISLEPTTAEVELSAAVPADRLGRTMDEELAIPGSLVTKSGQWVVLPLNEGIRLPVEDGTINNWTLVTYGGHGICMPWSGVVDPVSGSGAMTIVETPNDADVLYKQEDGLMSFQPRWEPSRGAFSYARRMRLAFFERGGFVAMAKRYRSYAKATGLFKTLAAKRQENPNIDRLIGAVNIWNWDMDKVGLCKEMKHLGMDRVLWSGGGSAEEIRTIGQLGYLPGRYDIYQDVWDPKIALSWMNTRGWPSDLVLYPNGDWMKGWSHPDRQPDGSIKWIQGGVICSEPGLARAKEIIPKELMKIPYQARFIDTTTASPFRECYNPEHPLSRGDDRKYKMALLDFCSKDMKLVTGSETGLDASVPYVAYFEGMMSLGPFRLPDAGTFMMEYRKPTPEFLKFQIGSVYRIPLWELVYHDCTVAQWYWGDASNKAPEVWDQRDLLNILYGTAPLLMFDKPKWATQKSRMLQTYKNVCEWVRKIGYDEMVSHEDLTPDHLVQKTVWSSGRSVTVNFGDVAFDHIAPRSFSVRD